MKEGPEEPTTRELLERIVRLEGRVDDAIKDLHELDDQIGKLLGSIGHLFDRIEPLELKNVADYHNNKIDKILDEYEKKNPPES